MNYYSQIAPGFRAIFAEPGSIDDLKVVSLATEPAEKTHATGQERSAWFSFVEMRLRQLTGAGDAVQITEFEALVTNVMAEKVITGLRLF